MEKTPQGPNPGTKTSLRGPPPDGGHVGVWGWRRPISEQYPPNTARYPPDIRPISAWYPPAIRPISARYRPMLSLQGEKDPHLPTITLTDLQLTEPSLAEATAQCSIGSVNIGIYHIRILNIMICRIGIFRIRVWHVWVFTMIDM